MPHYCVRTPFELSIKDKQTVNVPVWAGVGAIVIGGALLLLAEHVVGFRRRKRFAEVWVAHLCATLCAAPEAMD